MTTEPASETLDQALGHIRSERQRKFVRGLVNGLSGVKAAKLAGCKRSAQQRSTKWKRLPAVKHALDVWQRERAAFLAHRQMVIRVVYDSRVKRDDAALVPLVPRARQYSPDGTEIVVQFINPDPQLVKGLAQDWPESLAPEALNALESATKSEQ